MLLFKRGFETVRARDEMTPGFKDMHVAYLVDFAFRRWDGGRVFGSRAVFFYQGSWLQG